MNRRADLVFAKAKVAVFVDGCYWHGCPEHGTLPTTNADYWLSKIGGNIARDRETVQLLLDAGWLAVRIWEHDDAIGAAAAVADLVRARTRG